jgi:hypothetical protein
MMPARSCAMTPSSDATRSAVSRSESGMVST